MINLIKLIIIKFLASRGRVITNYNDHRLSIIRLITNIKSEGRMLLQYSEAYMIYMLVKNTAKIKGDLAEVGAYTGGSAKLICEAKGDREVYLFDTFEGLPKTTKLDTSFKSGEYPASYEDVRNYLKEYSHVHLIKGIFPKSAEKIKDNKFSFVHLDVDIYTSTKESLKFFYPRMNKGGAIISHDYVSSNGVRKAFDDFFKNKKEYLLQVSDSQCLIIKV
ncbi:MAG: hypothetical protein A3H17_04225 [Candidatus Levybacteria bacterium RIFCSPLOWO2_12_FULL_37_14]|nr:MAG: hypothetical protein US43_C0033G0002 [Candidatus Levybacteria bacterium GW2011_GWA1_37_16]KKQ36775.1 MAG: hypothetical protein US55_C0053G0010 [Candidatus Levybacteria bacterium GW2011_GWC2_37_7]OGH50451.1 MAG: hypothetical protein A3H17_04225 [Candidatus Levybacteria bacterium RIFCSPLOWO2_12_FULL_37_14]